MRIAMSFLVSSCGNFFGLLASWSSRLPICLWCQLIFLFHEVGQAQGLCETCVLSPMNGAVTLDKSFSNKIVFVLCMISCPCTFMCTNIFFFLIDFDGDLFCKPISSSLADGHALILCWIF